MSYYTLRNFFSVINIIKPFYLLCFFIFLAVYVIVSWVGRFNENLKCIIFSNDDVNSSSHLLRYTIFPTIIFVAFLTIMITRIIFEKVNWLDYGRSKSLVFFILFVIMFIVTCITFEMRKRRIFFDFNLKVFTNWIPLIILIFFMITTSIFFWNILG